MLLLHFAQAHELSCLAADDQSQQAQAMNELKYLNEHTKGAVISAAESAYDHCTTASAFYFTRKASIRVARTGSTGNMIGCMYPKYSMNGVCGKRVMSRNVVKSDT